MTAIDKVIEPLVNNNLGQTGLLLLDDNLDAFLIRAITARDAGRSLDLQYYIWHHDLTGNLLGYELLKAADRGVNIRLLLDDMNSHDKDTVLATLEQHPNIEVRLYNPLYNRKNRLVRGLEMVFRGISLNRRMHNKAWIVDGKLAVVGGRNIGNEYFDASPYTNFFDVDLLLIGDAVPETVSIFESFWSSNVVMPLNQLVSVDKQELAKLRQYVQDLDDNTIKETNIYLERLKQSANINELINGNRPLHWTKSAHVYSDPPEKAKNLNKEQWLINKLYPCWLKTQRKLRLISPYFVPGKETTELLGNLSDNGVSVGVLTNSLAATDVMLVHAGYVSYRLPLLKHNVKLYELMPYNLVKKKILGSRGASLHTKAFMRDDKLGFVGSFNLDQRSAKLNTEMGILFEQADIVKELLSLYGYKIELDNSYQLFLEKNRLRWHDGSTEPATIWEHEPETGIFRRIIIKIISYLPIESQL